MKRFIKSIKKTGRKMYTGAAIAVRNKRGEGFLDTALKILISIIIGALLLAGLYTLFGDTILPTLTSKIQDLFNYAG